MASTSARSSRRGRRLSLGRAAAEIGPFDIGLLSNLGRGTGELDPAGVEQVGAVDDVERHPHVLLDQQDRHARDRAAARSG